MAQHPLAVRRALVALAGVVLATAHGRAEAQSVVERAERLAAQTGRALVVLLTDDT